MSLVRGSYNSDELRTMTDEEWEAVKHFTKDEFACKETGEHGATRVLVSRVVLLRSSVGAPLIITSGYRSPRHSVERDKKKPGTHSSGLAVDIKCKGELAYKIVEHARACGFYGIGVKQKGAMESRFIHLDIALPGMIQRAARPWIWSY